MTSHARWISTAASGVRRAVPTAWKQPLFCLIVGRPWAFIAVAVIASPIGVLLSSDVTLSAISQQFFVFGIVLPLALTRGIVSGDRVPGRWLSIFQQPTTVANHYGRVFASGACMLTLLWMPAWLTLLVTAVGRGAPIAAALGLMLAAWLWTMLVFLVGIFLSASMRSADTELGLFWLFLSFMQLSIIPALRVPEAGARISRLLLVPVEPMFQLWRLLWKGEPGLAVPGAIHLALFVLVLAMVVANQLRRLDRSDLATVFG